MVHLDATNEEYGIRRVVRDDPRNTGKFSAAVYCGVTGNCLIGTENIAQLEQAKMFALKLAQRYYI